jgi:hypothetical protein
VVAPDNRSVREESSSNTGRNNNGSPVSRRKKTDFKDNTGEFGVQLPLPTAMWKSPHQAESSSSEEVEEVLQG